MGRDTHILPGSNGGIVLDIVAGTLNGHRTVSRTHGCISLNQVNGNLVASSIFTTNVDISLRRNFNSIRHLILRGAIRHGDIHIATGGFHRCPDNIRPTDTICADNGVANRS